MSWNPNQGQTPDQQGQYGGYSGYTPPTQPQPDPYGSQQSTGYQPPFSSGGQQQQYQSTYQPPLSARARMTQAAGASDPTSLKMDPKNQALLSYLFLFLGGFVFFILERKNRFVRFHAAQSFIFSGGVTVLYIVLRLLTLLPVVGFLLSPILSCALFVLLVPSLIIWLFLMIMAYRGSTIKLPVIGSYAEALVEKFTRKPRTV
ncbi:MAG: hypothetical protein M3Z08_18985 [Chloroflexota bacterium]|nr:hypothetical protein [Chloroflexota bacterium]